jgi:hypothetical protein
MSALTDGARACGPLIAKSITKGDREPALVRVASGV